MAIERSLNDPKSADWTDKATWPFVDTVANAGRVTVTLRARNAFNALMLATFECDAKLDRGYWFITSLKQTAP